MPSADNRGGTAWTPGPWLHNPYDDWRDICQRTGPNSCHVIATVSYSVDGEGDATDRANARLIAAAPNMFEAASALIADVRRRYPGEELRCEYMRALDAALRKATGESA